MVQKMNQIILFLEGFVSDTFISSSLVGAPTTHHHHRIIHRLNPHLINHQNHPNLHLHVHFVHQIIHHHQNVNSLTCHIDPKPSDLGN